MKTTAFGMILFLVMGCSKFEERSGEGGSCNTNNDCKIKPIKLICVNHVCIRPETDITTDIQEVSEIALEIGDVVEQMEAKMEFFEVPEKEDTTVYPEEIEIGDVQTEAVEDDVTVEEFLEAFGEDMSTEIQSYTGKVCSSDEECGENGKCVDWTNDKKICSGQCPCPEGMFCGPVAKVGKIYEYRCIPFPHGLCYPCETEKDCPEPNSWCLSLAGGKFCTSPCPDAKCPDGFGCLYLDIPEIPSGAKSQCVPETGTCVCIPEKEGEIFVCSISSEYGKCTGSMTCNPSLGWTKCSAFLPSPEVCNQIDDDCDGNTDTGFFITDWDGKTKGIGEACGTGACANGKVVCQSDKEATCDTWKYKSEKETCGDGVDNDCDGNVDEDCYSTDIDGDGFVNEGDCAPFDAGKFPGADEPCCPLNTPEDKELEICDYDCDGKVTYCDPNDKDSDGYISVLAGGDDCDDSDPKTHPDAFEKCGDGIDQDCSGEDLPCSSIVDKDGDGYAKGKGGDCNDDDPLIHPNAQEYCDYIDNDCDGLTDEENVGGGEPCGPSKGECKPGILVCSHYPPAGVKLECIGAKGPQEEICDNLDNDCNGLTDELFPDKGQPCDGNDADFCKNGTWSCTSDGTSLECVNEKIKDILEECNGKDDDCDGVIDNGCWPEDLDGDGFLPPEDCDDTRSEVNPKAKEPCVPPNLPPEEQMKYDWNCDGKITPCSPDDKDFDGYIAKSAGGDDCDDNDPKVYPGAPEICGNNKDEDCNGVDIACSGDKDGDGFLPPAKAGDCNDSNAEVHPYAEELCDYIDNDCDGITDEGNPEAQEGECGSSIGECKPGKWVCVHYAYEAKVECVVEKGPSLEICDGKDNNCNGLTDEYFPDKGMPCDGPDSDLCKNGIWECKEDGTGLVCSQELVEDIKELCDGIDNDCDGLTDEDFTYQGKKIGEPCKGIGECGYGKVECAKDKKSGTCSTNPNGSESQAKQEVCDGLDNDCDGVVDNGLFYNGIPIGGVCLGVGECGPGKVECSQITGKPTCSSNPDGSLPKMKPEKCNGLDDDCDGHTDEDVIPKPGDCNNKGVCEGFLIPAKCKKGKWICDYSVVPGYEGPNEKSCDGIDNNCDGNIDEIFMIGKPCDGPDSDKCENGTWTCKDDKSGSECVNETIENIEELCNGKDDDCDGVTDNGFPVGEPCDTEDTDLCKNGIFVCSPDGKAVICPFETIVNIQETCNNQDDDCDGIVDNGFPVGEPCDGPDPDKCATGHFICSLDGKGVDCVDDVGEQTSEICDGKDNDCDGLTDEDFTYKGLKIGDACVGIGACGEGVVKCKKDQSGATCSTNPDGPDSQATDEICDGKDNDCDGETDEGMTWEGKKLGDQCWLPGECGSGVVVCSEKTFDAICSTMEKIGPEICDGKDNDCNGLTDDIKEGDKSGCKTKGICKPELVEAYCVEGKWKCDYSKVVGYIETQETLCNGIDENCDGDVDDAFPTGEPCDGLDTDLCKNGTFTCTNDGLGVECINETTTNIKEVCGDGIDNDCNGFTDEENASGCVNYYLDKDQDNYGQPGMKKCLCKKGDVPFYTAPTGNDCNDDDKSVNPGVKEICNGIDDNCNGKTDETFLDLGKPCDGPDDDLCKNGIFKCTEDGKGVYCADDYNLPETCNGKDDDCDGLTDEDFLELGKPCDGDDTDKCKNGTFTCKPDGSGVECVNENPTNIVELCNGKDDDCDGLVDEDFNIGEPCDGPDNDLCKNGKWQCKKDGSGAECIETIENIQELCDGIDNDCDGLTDEDWPNKGKKCDEPPDGCFTGVWMCAPNKTSIICSGDYKCVSGAKCQDSGAPNLRDECLCGLFECHENIATICIDDGKEQTCACGVGPYCKAPQKCIGGKCQ